jgi:hypothetical protein
MKHPSLVFPLIYHHLSFPPHLLSNDLGLSRRGAALNTLSSWAVDVVLWDPALIIRLLSQSTSSDSWSISANNGNLVVHVDSLLGASRRSLGALTTLTTTASLREEGFDPGLVDKVESSGEGGAQEEVQEDAKEG